MIVEVMVPNDLDDLSFVSVLLVAAPDEVPITEVVPSTTLAPDVDPELLEEGDG